MYTFSDLILDNNEAAVCAEKAEKTVQKAEKRVKYVCDVEEPDIVFTKKTIYNGKETINGQAVFLITQHQYYLQTYNRGRKAEPYIYTGTNADEFALKLSTFFNKLPKTENGREMSTASDWLPKIRTDKNTFLDFLTVINDDLYLKLIMKGYFRYNPDFIACHFEILNDDLFMIVLEEAVKVLGQDTVRKTVSQWMYHRRQSWEGVSFRLWTLIAMCGEENTTRNADGNWNSSAFMENMRDCFGISGIRSFVSTYLSVINPYAEGYSSYYGGFTINPSIFYKGDDDDTTRRVFSLKKLTEYLTYSTISQGFNSMQDFIDMWNDTLNMQETLYGKIKDKYPEHLTSSHDLLSAKIALMRRVIDKKKFMSHAEREKAFRYSPKGKKYIITSPESEGDMTDEATQQQNCLSSYIEAFAEDLTDIYFMRYAGSPDQSLVTIEVKNRKVRQAFRARNRQISSEESAFIAEWAEKNGIEYMQRDFNPLAAPAA